MTLIIGVRCSDGIAVCADSQETVGNYRVSVKKINPQRMGNYVVMVGGSGIGPLVDDFIECLREKVAASTTKSKGDFKKLFETELRRFRKEDIPLYNAKDEDKWLAFVVAIYVNGGHEIWTTKGAKLKSVPDFCVVGWDEPLYTLILKRLYRPDLTLAQGILAGIYTLAAAEATSNCVRGPMQAGGVNDSGAWLDGSGYVADMNNRLQMFEQRINSMLLASADIGLNLAQYKQMLNDFSNEAMKLHKESLVFALRRFLDAGSDAWRLVNAPYNRIPPALSIAMKAGDLDDVLGPGEREDLVKKMVEAAKAAYPVGPETPMITPSTPRKSPDQR